MKKLMIASAIAMTMAAGSAMASQGEIQFFGNVTTQTCDLEPEVNGAVNKMLQLGTATVNNDGPVVEFVLKAKNPTVCAEADKLGAFVSWDGNLATDGIGNQSGSAVGAHVELKGKNAKAGNDKPVSSAFSVVEFEKGKLINDGLQFTAQLKGGAAPGDYKSAVAYAVTYQ
ncbi:TPA_asm: fimbrial protein [Salmonella enterica subsp. enterica serovar Typhimurium str. SL1344]|uniref:Fimbrial protein n=1 Tax=Salmonella typhimurium (strain SL1344) TaxID=216597 RepID=A0A718RJQ3_SALTS|nr:fimbrial protein [Salmonella enterica]HAD6674443.1 fimbrial protein [Salmonella enterica subsp. enterica serovar Typhimurium str. SL1344]HAD6692707.1 fimbrial protein [Salmonella enterica subsp. enterica serovar Typhimurium str. SL1344]HAD6716156.1 fimbrial protein [Salmonella enterica subsp. enterica serovar Typhimurium str. SL1344]